MEIRAEKTKLMTNSAYGIQRELEVSGKKIGTVSSFKNHEAAVSDVEQTLEVLFNGCTSHGSSVQAKANM